MRESIFTKEIILSKVFSRLILIFFFVFSIALSAYVRIPLPFSPVPVTLQTLFVLLNASLLKSRLGTLSIIIYIMLGILGTPVFTFAPAGIFYLFGPTGGYLFGFILASFLIGKILSCFKRCSYISVFISLLLGDLIILVLGTIWLKVLLVLNFKEALILGCLPFVPFELIKIWIATKLFMTIKPRIEEII